MPLQLSSRPSLFSGKGHRSGEGTASLIPPMREEEGLRPQPAAAPDESRNLFRALSPLRAGKYLISPLVKSLENGWYACSVSIRSGSGRGTTDRVLRLTRLFRNGLEAADYARGEGLQWISAPPSP